MFAGACACAWFRRARRDVVGWETSDHTRRSAAPCVVGCVAPTGTVRRCFLDLYQLLQVLGFRGSRLDLLHDLSKVVDLFPFDLVPFDL